MLIFDNFKTREQADNFSRFVHRTYGLKTWVYDNQEDSVATDIFPFKLDGVIVHVQRTLDDRELKIGRSVRRFGGRFAGT